MGAMERSMRRVLALACLVYLAMALGLLGVPNFVGNAIGQPPGQEWGLRLAGAFALGLAGQSWLVRRADAAAIRGASLMTFVACAAICIIVAALPGSWTGARWAVVAVLGVLGLTGLGLTMASLRHGHVLER